MIQNAPTANIHAVFFDLDETLIEHTRSIAEIGEDLYRCHEDALDHVDQTEFLKVLWQKANDMWYMMIDGALPGEIARPYMFKNTLRQLEADESIAESMLQRFGEIIVDSTRLYPDAEDALEALRSASIAVGIITNGYTDTQRRKIEHHGLAPQVDHIFISESVGAHTPDRRIFETALKTAGAEASRALHIGDHWENDVTGSLDAGMGGVLYDPLGERIKRRDEDASLPEPHAVIAKLGEVLDLVG